MSVPRRYLDTSALVKRYVIEAGSDYVTGIFRNAETRSDIICISRWNIGEAAVVFNKYQSKKKINAKERMELMLNELGRMKLNGGLTVEEVDERLIADSIILVLDYHLYIADALQIASAKDSECEDFTSADRYLCEVAEKNGLATHYLG